MFSWYQHCTRPSQLFLLCILLFFNLIWLLPALVSAEPVEVIPPQYKTLSSANGRYVFGQVSGFGKDQYMLDTKTGRLWRVVKTQKGYLVMEIVPYRKLDGSESTVPSEIEDEVVFQLMNKTNNEKKDNTKKIDPN